MGLLITASVVCDKDLTTTAQLQSVDGPLPENWGRVQGYVNISGGDSQRVGGYFCPACVALYGTTELVKCAADGSSDLTGPQS